MGTKPKQDASASSAAPTAAQSFAANMKAAGQLVAKQAERTKIVQVTLATAYFALGKNLYTAGSLRNDFPEAFKAVEDLLSATKAIDAQASGRIAGDGLAARAKAAGQSAMDMAQKKKLQVQANYALSTLGKLAFEKLGEQSGSPDVVQPIVDAHARLSALDAEIAQLSESKSGGFVTPKRIVAAAAVLLVLGSGYIMLPRLAGTRNTQGQGFAQMFGVGLKAANSEFPEELFGDWKGSGGKITIHDGTVVIHGGGGEAAQKAKYTTDAAGKRILFTILGDREVSATLVGDELHLEHSDDPGKVWIHKRPVETAGARSERSPTDPSHRSVKEAVQQAADDFDAAAEEGMKMVREGKIDPRFEQKFREVQEDLHRKARGGP